MHRLATQRVCPLSFLADLETNFTNQWRSDADDTEEASCGTLTWKIPSSTPQQEEGLPPGFPCAVSPAGLLYLLLGQASIVDSRFVLYLVSSAMFYPCIRLFCSLTAPPPLRGACKWYSASFKSKWESLTLCLQTLRRHVWNVKSLIGLWHWSVSDI